MSVKKEKKKKKKKKKNSKEEDEYLETSNSDDNDNINNNNTGLNKKRTDKKKKSSSSRAGTHDYDENILANLEFLKHQTGFVTRAKDENKSSLNARVQDIYSSLIYKLYSII